jgi:excisionase family DNA binding protein
MAAQKETSVSEMYISVDEAADEIGVSRATFWKWIKRYEVPTFRFMGERRTFVRREDVAKLKEPIPVDPSKKCAT